MHEVKWLVVDTLMGIMFVFICKATRNIKNNPRVSVWTICRDSHTLRILSAHDEPKDND